MSEVLVLSASFGRWSEEPVRMLAEAGVRVRRPSVPGPLTSAQLQAEIGSADALVVALDEVDAAAVAAGPHLKVIAKHGVGVDNIDVAAAAARGITVVNAPGTNSEAVADLVLALLLNLLRQVRTADASLRRGDWETFPGPELGDLTLGIAGYGRIGRAVARRAAGFGSRVLAHDPFLDADGFAGAEMVPTLSGLLEQSQVLTLHLPGTGGDPLVGAPELARMPPGSYLVNTARGDLVDEDAVAAALHSGHLAGYAADAFRTEPPTGSPLLTAPRTLLTPHVGAFTGGANRRMGTTVVADVLAVLDGRPPAHPVLP